MEASDGSKGRLVATGRVSPVVCPRCGQRLKATDVSVELLVGLCRRCDVTVELTRQVPAQAGDVREGPPAELIALTTPPAGIEAVRDGEALVLTRRWFTLEPKVLFQGLFCVVWDGFLLLWYALAIPQLLAGEAGALVMVLFPVLHVAAGVGITYAWLATVLNSSTIRVDRGHLTVTHGPVLWHASEPIPSGAIDQLYLTESGTGDGRTYNLMARRSDLTSVALLEGLPRDDQARYLERRIEAHLGLVDRVVEGEYTS